MSLHSDTQTPLERAILEQIAYLEAYLAQVHADQRTSTETADDPMLAALRDPGFQRWQLLKRLEQPL